MWIFDTGGVWNMNIDWKKALTSAGVFVGVLLVMCLAAKLIIHSSANITDGVIRESGEKERQAGPSGSPAAPDETGETPTQTSSGPSYETGETTGTPDAPTQIEEAPTDTPSPAEETPTPTEEIEEPAPDGKPIICIDAAHQSKADTGSEPIGPGASQTKYKCTSGASGKAGTTEFETNLLIALLLRDELTSRGYGVIMIRETSDVNISDATRAQTANETANIVIHIHCNADERDNINGIMAFTPSDSNKYVSGDVRAKCLDLGNALIRNLAATTQARNWGVISNDNLTALNWTKIPASHVEVGYLTSEEDEARLSSQEYRVKIAKGLADGIDEYCASLQ